MQRLTYAIAQLLMSASITLLFANTRIEVTKDIVVPSKDYEPLGVNNFGDVGGTKHTNGNILLNAGFEPIRIRRLYRVIESGKDKGKCWITLDGPGTSNWLLYTTGTFSGAKMRAYRFLDGSGNPLPFKSAGWAQGKKILDAKTGKKCVPLFTTRVLPRGSSGFPEGGWIAPSTKTFGEWTKLGKAKQAEIKKLWRVYYEADTALRMDDVVIFERSFIWPDPKEFHPRTSERGIHLSDWTLHKGSARQVPLPSNAPAAMNGGKGCLEMTAGDGEARVWNKFCGGTARGDASWYGTLEEGLKYQYEAWVCAKPGANGSLTLTFGDYNKQRSDNGYFGQKIGKSFPVTNKWQKVGFEFTAPAAGKDGIGGATLKFLGSGSILIDNVKLQPIYEAGDEDKPFVIYRKLFKTMMDNQPATGRKGALRIWFGLNSASMESLFDWEPENGIGLGVAIRISPYATSSLPKAMTIVEATGKTPETRMVPWLMTQVTHTEEEHRQLIEYLCAPYDPKTDSPKSKPMAYKRYQHRGHGRPWSADFREIIIEFGNENWHNRSMAKWIGMGRSGTVHQSGIEYGLWAKHMIAEMKKSPYWLDKKLRVCLGGNYSANVNADGSVSGYGQEATVAAEGANDYHSHATYIGPRWETGERSQASIDDKGVQRTLFAYRLRKELEWKKQEATHKRMREMGLKARMSAYEGGPSGFGLRAKSKAEDRAGEYYGKSYAMATAMMDAWLHAYEMGWTYQCYLGFGQGRWWASHTSLSQGHRPSPSWLVQTLINRHFANKDILGVRVQNGPTVDAKIPKTRWERNLPDTQKVALIQAHASGGPKEVTVAISNLDLSKAHPVEISLPMKSVSEITCYYLEGGPRDSNLDSLKIKIASKKLPRKSYKKGILKQVIPAGSPVIYVFSKK